MAYGKQGWGQKSNNSSYQKIDYKEKFLKLTDGKKKVTTSLRVISDLYSYLSHVVFFPGDIGNSAKYGRNIPCSVNDCPLCAQGNKAKEKFYVAVLVKKTGEVKYLDMKWGLKMAFESAKDSPTFDPEEGEERQEVKPTEHWSNVIADPGKGSTGFYTVLPAAKTPLTANEILIKESVDFDTELEKMIEVPTSKEIQDKIDRIEKWIAINANKQESESNENEEEKPQKQQKTQKVQQKFQQKQQQKAVIAVNESDDEEESKEESSDDEEENDFSFKNMRR